MFETFLIDSHLEFLEAEPVKFSLNQKMKTNENVVFKFHFH